MRIDLPDFEPSLWGASPWWMLWRGRCRRLAWRWTVDAAGCRCSTYWQYQ